MLGGEDWKLPTFRNNLFVPFSKVKKYTARLSQTSITNYQSKLHNIKQGRRSRCVQLHDNYRISHYWNYSGNILGGKKLFSKGYVSISWVFMKSKKMFTWTYWEVRITLITRVGTLIVATIYLQLIQNRYMFRSFTVLQCSHQHCVKPVASDVEVVGYL